MSHKSPHLSPTPGKEDASADIRLAMDQIKTVVALLESNGDTKALDVNDVKYCLATIKSAAQTLEKVEKPAAGGRGSRLNSIATSEGDLVESEMGTDVSDNETPIPLSPGDASSFRPMAQHQQSKAGGKLTTQATLMAIPSVDIMRPTPRELESPNGGLQATQHNKWHNPFREAKVIEEHTAEDEGVAKWLNANFADQYHRESTGFDVKLQRSNSIVSSYATPRGAERDEEEDSLFLKNQLIMPDGSRCIPTKYARTHQRTYPAFATRRKFEACLRLANVEAIPGINDSDFDIFPHYDRLGDNVFTVICANVILQYNFINSLGVNVEYFMNFLRELQLHYSSANPYHNGCHAADVLQTTNVYLCTGEVKENFSDVELIAILFGAMCHDVGHPGISNNFLNKVRHPLSQLYNDVSTLESMHTAMAFIILDKPECNFFETSRTWTKHHEADFRGLVVEIILGTDMKNHAAMMQSVTDILDDGQIEDDEVARLFKAIVHAADLSNPMKPLPVYLNWMERVLAEYWQQGDEERRRGIDISMLCDRNNPTIFKSQVGFIEFVVKPLMQELAPVLPPVWIERLMSNLAYVKAGAADAEAASLKRIEALAAKPWVDVPIRSHSFITVIMKYFDAYRLTSQLAHGSNAVTTSGHDSPWGRSIYPGLATQRTTIETHQTRFAEDAERWLHQILAYRPASTYARAPSLVSAALAGRETLSPNLRDTTSSVGLPSSDADERFFERFCASWIINILEFQMQQRLQNHGRLDENHAADAFVPYLEEGAATLIASSPEAQVYVRRREDEDKKMEMQLSVTLDMIAREAGLEDVEGEQTQSVECTPRDEALAGSWTEEEPKDDGKGRAEDAHTWSWLKKDKERGEGKRLAANANAAASLTKTNLSKGSSTRKTLLQAFKASEYVADEDVLISAIGANANLAVRAVEYLVGGAAADPAAYASPLSTTAPAASPDIASANGRENRTVVRVIEPAPEPKAAGFGPRFIMIRFINALTKMLVVTFRNHVKRAAREGRRSSLVNGDSAVATVDAASVLNISSVRERTTKWIEELYTQTPPNSSPSQPAHAASSKPTSPALPDIADQTAVPVLTVDMQPAEDNGAIGGAGGTGSRRPSGRSDYPASVAGTEPHIGAPRTPMDPSIMTPLSSPLSTKASDPTLRRGDGVNDSSATMRPLRQSSSSLRDVELPANFGGFKLSKTAPPAGADEGANEGTSKDRGSQPRARSTLQLASLVSSDSEGGVGLPAVLAAALPRVTTPSGVVSRRAHGNFQPPLTTLERTSVVKYVATVRRLDADRLSQQWDARVRSLPSVASVNKDSSATTTPSPAPSLPEGSSTMQQSATTTATQQQPRR